MNDNHRYLTTQQVPGSPHLLDVLVPANEYERQQNQLAAAERLYEATHDYLIAWEDTNELADKLHKALDDYANAKGE